MIIPIPILPSAETGYQLSKKYNLSKIYICNNSDYDALSASARRLSRDIIFFFFFDLHKKSG